MHAMTIAGVGYALLDIPLKIFPFRPLPKPKLQWSQLVGGKRKEVTSSSESSSEIEGIDSLENPQEVFTCRADPSSNRFQRDRDEKHHGDCFPDMIIVTTHTLRWRYPAEFIPNTTIPNTIKKVRNMIANLIETDTLASTSEMDAELVRDSLYSNFMDNIKPDANLSEEAQRVLCIKLMRRTENESPRKWYGLVSL